MAHFARINENGIVTAVQVIANAAIDGGNFPESEPLGQALQESLGLEGRWLQCSYSGSFRGAYPGPGWSYDPMTDEFIPPAETEQNIVEE